MPAFLTNIPRAALLAVVPLAVFLLAAAISFGMGGDDDPEPGASALAPTVAIANTAVATAVATVLPTATPLADRTSCSEIQGTDYRSATEQAWFKANCGGSGGGGSAVPRGGTGGGNTGGPSIAAGSEYALGDRLVIPAAGVNASVSGIKVGSDGVMPDPKGYFNALW